VLLSSIQVVLSFAFFQITSQWLTTQFDENLKTVSVQVSGTLEDVENADEDDINFQFDESSIASVTYLRDRLFFIRVIDLSTGAILDESQRYPIPVHIPANAQAIETFALQSDPQQVVRIFTQRFGQNDQYGLQVGQSFNDVLNTQRQILRLLIVSVGLTAVLSALSGWFLAQRALQPVKALTRIAHEINERDLSRRITTPMPDDELGQLSGVFNQMLDRIEAAFQRQKQFTADAAHELRTPLSIMQTGLDVALEQERTSNVYQNVLENLRGEVVRMTHLTTSLLMLARSDTQQMALKRQPTDLSLLLHTTADQFTAAANYKHIIISRHISASIVVNVDEERFIQLALNLLDNAIKYTSEGGMITVTLIRLDGRVRFDISDTGIGIPTDQLAQIFNRFYRVDRARTRAQGGFGLGLAIARQIVELHSGTITASSQIGIGTTISVTVPISPASDHHLTSPNNN